MKRATLLAAVLLAALIPATAFAESRPVTPSDGGSNVETRLNSLGLVSTDPVTDQVDIQRWQRSLTGNSALTLQLELTDAATGNEIGVFNALWPFDEFKVFPKEATPGMYAVVSFETDGDLIVNVFNGITPVYSNSYSGVTSESFGFYIKNDANTGYSQDSKNPGESARTVVFEGTGGSKVIFFEDGLQPADDAEKKDFDDVVVIVDSMSLSTPVTKATWSALKSRFR